VRVSHFVFVIFLPMAPQVLTGRGVPESRPSELLEVSATATTETLIKEVESRYNRAQTLSLRFEETFEQGRPHRPESGTLTLRKPGRMRWDYDQPPGKLFVSDGKMAYLYTPRDNRVQRSSLKMSEDMRAPMAFLLGRLDLKRAFRGFSIHPGDGGTWLEALAKDDRAPYEKIELLVAPDASIRRLNVRGRDQSVLTFAFSAESLNPPVTDRAFRFTIPAGAEVVDAVTSEQEN
jgi:outer membrane lipoprotein carrier protein